MNPSKIGYPGERMAMDIVGHFPVTERGNKYILVVCDYFTKWTEKIPISNQEAQTGARVLASEVICRYGAPVQLHADQGRNFVSTQMKELCDLLETKKTRTTPYHPKPDGLVERFNRTLEAMLSKYLSENQRDWDTRLRFMLAYRSNVHESTKHSLFFMTFGRGTFAY